MRTREQVYENMSNNFEGIKQASSFADKESMMARVYFTEILETLLDIRDILQEQNKPKELHHEFNHDIKEAFTFTAEPNKLMDISN